MEKLKIINHEKGEWMGTDYFITSQIMVLEPAVSAPLGNLVEMQIWGLQTKATESETLRVGSINLCFNILEKKILISSLGDSDAC